MLPLTPCLLLAVHTRSTIIFLEIFGSPFMRNASVILALLFGYLIAAVTNYQGKKYVITTKIDQAPGITFLWTTTFPLGERLWVHVTSGICFE